MSRMACKREKITFIEFYYKEQQFSHEIILRKYRTPCLAQLMSTMNINDEMYIFIVHIEVLFY